MLKSKKNFVKIMILITLISMLWAYIEINTKSNKKTKDSYSPEIKHAMAEQADINTGTIDPIYRPKWEKVSSQFNADNKTMTVKIKGSAYANLTIDDNTSINYSSDVTSVLAADDITLYIDGIEVTDKTVPKITVDQGTISTNETTGKKEITNTIVISNFDEVVRQAGKDYKEWSGNIAVKIGGRGKDSSTYNSNTLKDEYGNHSLMEIQKGGTWLNIALKDTKTDHNTDGTLFADFIGPEITYIYADSDIDHLKKTLTVDFSLTDKYFKSTKYLNADGTINQTEVNKITVAMLDDNTTQVNSKVTKTLTKLEEIKETRDGKEVTIGIKFRLVLGNLEQQSADGKYREYSGPMSIAFPDEVADDLSGNVSEGKTITIGINEPDNTGGQQVVDVVDPVWSATNIQKVKDSTTGKMTVTMDIQGTDKYFKRSSLTADQIQVWVDGVDITATGSNANITRTLEKVEDLTETRDGKTVTYGIHYKFTLKDLEESDTAFFAERAKYATNSQTGRVYREYSGNTVVRIPANTMVDNYNNKNLKLDVALNQVDTLKPEIIKVSSTKTTSNKKETFVFDVVDKYLATTKLGTTVAEANTNKDFAKVYVDGEQTTGVTKNFTSVEKLSATVNGTSRTVGYRYTIELTNFEQTRTAINYDREYSDWSGNVSLRFDAGTAIDTSGNASAETTLVGDFIDFIKPNVTYQYTESNIDYESKTFTMVFDVTDKFFKTGSLAISDLGITIDGEVPDWNKVTRTLQVADIKNTVHVTENGVEKEVEKVIGKRYTLTLSNLEQIQVRDGNNYLDYSGVISVVIPKDKFEDTTGNKNNETTLTSGITIPGGNVNDEQIVDVVDPLVKKESTYAKAADKTAKVVFTVTDKYFKNSTLTKENIEVWVNGAKSSATRTLTAEDLTEERVSGGSTTNVKYGVRYTLNITGYNADVNQVKIKVPQGVVTDNSGNGNKETEIIVYNTLKETASETQQVSGFLGSANSTKEKVKIIQRMNIDNITFVDSLANKIDDTAWDVSAQGDNSIMAWYTTNSNGTLKVYIGSDYEIFGNYKSWYLFSKIGYSEKCTSTETITNLSALNVSSVVGMYNMFSFTGYNAMTKLDLGTNFDTSSATTMSAMFYETGYKSMTTLNLGTSFNTSKVINMEWMFYKCGYTAMTGLNLENKFYTNNVTSTKCMFMGTGYTAMTTLNLGGNFDTSTVTNMGSMFASTGYTAMTSLDLGEKFNTSAVTDMSYMFFETGYTAMTTLNLEKNFDTSSVTTMEHMFDHTGYTAMTSLNLEEKFNTINVNDMNYMFAAMGTVKMTSLNLGDSFYTTKVTKMTRMFSSTGTMSMTILDLGPAFTKITEENEGIFYGTGKDGEITIHASEQIYLDKNNFKLNTDADTTDATKVINYTRGTINPKYRTEWVKEASALVKDNTDLSKSKITITLRGRTNAEAGVDFTSDVESSLTADKIHVYVDGEEATGITKTLANANAVKNTVTGANDVTQVLTLSDLDQGRIGGKAYKEWSGNISLKIDKKTLKDTTYSNQNLQAIDTTGEMVDIEIKETDQVTANKNGTMFADYIRPEFTYVYSDGNINYTDKTLTVEFSVTDKYFNTSTVLNNKDNIAIKLIDTNPNVTIPNDKITKELTKTEDITDTVNGETVKVGEKYKLVIKGLQQQTADGNYKDYSGPMSISFPAGVATDNTGNASSAQTITIGVNEPGGNSDDQKIVDVVDPLWKTDNINIDKANKKVTVDLIGTDKYYASNTLTTDKIKVTIDGEEVTTTANVKKALSTATPLTETRDGKTVTYGVKYTLTLSDWEETSKQTNKDFFEWSGTTKIEIAEKTLTDESKNTSKAQTFELGHVDFIQPKIEKVSSAKDASAKTETFVFNVIDKYLDTTDLVTTDEISVYVDGELVPSNQITRTLTKESDITGMVKGTSTVVGHQYKLVLSNFEQKRTSINYNREYSDWSGNVSIKISAGAVKDTDSPTPNTNAETTIAGDFVDFIKPNATYKLADSDIDYDGKTFTMVFDVTDKYYTSGTLTIDDLNIKIDGEEPNWDSTGVHGVIKTLDVTDRTNTVNGASKVIGKRYTLKLSHLEQLEKLAGKETMDYSGVISVAIPADKLVDTSNNKNDALTITSGIEVKGEAVTANGTVVDVVDPIWERVSSSASAADQTATITVKGTDKYFASSNLTADKIKIIVNGAEVSSNVSINVGDATPEYSADGTTRIGDRYTITVSGSGLPKDANQIKLQIQPDTITDKSGNTNKATDLLVYNALIRTDTEKASTSGFLGSANSANTNIKAIQRQNIDNVTFVDNIPTTVYDKSAKKIVNENNTWDVSAMQDKSILAWYTTNDNGTLKVYIGSDYEIFGNYDSTELFAYIGFSENCISTETITNIGLLNVGSVINMESMFCFTGYKAMTKLDLEDNFYTGNVTKMESMFFGTGQLKMTLLKLGEKFDTKNVLNMEGMFAHAGKNAMTNLDLGKLFDTSKVMTMSGMFCGTGMLSMTTLDLGEKFDTKSVKNMGTMFAGTGIIDLNLGKKFDTSNVTDMHLMFSNMEALKTLDLGEKFDTSNVVDMSEMFMKTGCDEMTSFSLGEKFNTSNVKNMNRMFYSFAHNIENLDLGDKFYTTNVTDMEYMFLQTGNSAMTTLDLGPAFTKIASINGAMFTNTGKDGEITIYASEQIYKDKNNFKLNTDADTTDTSKIINFTNGTIIPKYRTEWAKEASALVKDSTDISKSTISITLRGRTNAEAGVDFTSDVASTLTADKIHVYFDGEEATGITKQIATATTTTNAVTGANDVLQVITLSDIVEGLRQQGKSYKEWSGNISLKIDKKTLKDTTYSNQNLQAIDTTGEMIDIEIKETENINANSNGTMFTDYVKPEFTYNKMDTTIVHGNGEKVEVTFDVTDKYFDKTTLTKTDGTYDASQITVSIDDYDVTALNKSIKKELTKVEDITATVNGEERKVGERYQLTITGLDQKDENGVGDGFKYSGYMTLLFKAGAISDKSGNTSDATSITIGRNEPGGSDSDKEIVDVVDPVWSVSNADTTEGTIKLRVSDKFLIKDKSTFKLTADDITVLTNGVASTEITKQLTGPEEIVADQVYEYTLNLGNITPEIESYTEFTPTEPIVGGTAKYKNENGGKIDIKISAGTVIDAYTNATNEQTLEIGNIDGTGPEVYLVQKTQDADASKETIIFNVTDKNYNPDDPVTLDEISIWVDGKQVDDEITKTILSTVPIKAMIDGSERTVGHQYTVEIADIVETDEEFVATGKAYRELSGTLELRIKADASRDIAGNTINPATTTLSDFVDYIKPEARYKYSESDIDYNGKTFKMKFDIADKYLNTINLPLENLNILIDGEEPNWDNTGVHGVVKELESTDITAIINGKTKVVGKHYTLTLSHLEQLEKLAGKDTMDYSGVITVAIPANVAVDTSTKGNDATTITSGIDILSGNVNTEAKVVDVVDPIWERVSSTASAADQTATITVKGTDKYFKSSSLTADKIKVLVNGAEVSTNVNVEVGSQVTDVMSSDGKSKIGEQYTVKVSGTGLPKDANQIKIQIQPNTLLDNSNNTNKATDLLVYNALKCTYTGEYDQRNNSECGKERPFLGNTNIQRQNIDNVTFVDNIPSTVYDKSAQAYVDTTAWDVSAQQDKSILAWYETNANGSVKVYIGSDYEIFGNYDSTDLFTYVGYSNKCTSGETITNIDLLNVGSVTNMQGMFKLTGYYSMTELDLKDNFDTSNVTNMNHMFDTTGYLKMSSLKLGDKFNTSKVTDMSHMFELTGKVELKSLDLKENFYTSNVTNMSYMFSNIDITSLKLGINFDTKNVTDMSYMFHSLAEIQTLELGDKFDTSKVTNMEGMFARTGFDNMKVLDFKDKFDTSNVTNMKGMFYCFGKVSMTELKLPNKFDTSKVTNMMQMFEKCGTFKMQSLNLGNKFYTTNVSNMYRMFEECGTNNMITLDLGPAFTKIPSEYITESDRDMATIIISNYNAYEDIFSKTGKSGEITIYASEQIYKDKNNFKLNTDADITDTTKLINYTRGTINPKYRTEWAKESSKITIDSTDLSKSTISITLRGRTNAEAGVDFTSDVASTLTADKIHVYFDGEEASSVTKAIGAVSTAKNAITGANDVIQVLTLSDFEQALRQQGKEYKEWSGHISLKIDKKTLKDTTYSNQNLQAIDTTGEMLDIVLKETDEVENKTNSNTDGTMFTDYIRPEFTYEYSDTEINYTDKNVKVVFSATDKYFEQSGVSLDNMELLVDGVEPDWTKVERTLKKKTLDEDITDGTTIYKANGDIYTIVNGKEQKIGERYELKIDKLETKNAEGYSGPLTIAFKENIITDKSGNGNFAKTITIGIDDPGHHEDHKDPVIVDVVNPQWSYGTSTINRIRDGEQADTVTLTIIGSDKYYSSNSLTEDKIKVYVDDNLESSITKQLTQITDTSILKTLATKQKLADVDNLKFVGYKLTLGNFNKINGVTKIVIDAGTIQDESGNKNIETTIFVGNPEWVESGDSTTNPIYPAFRDSIVDFNSPTIKYTYSTVEGTQNPEIDYVAKTLTVKFTVTDKYIRDDSIMNADGSLNSDNIRIKVAGTDLTEQLHTTVKSKAIDEGTEYTFVVSNFELVYNEAEKYKDYSGAVDFVFSADKVDDTSGNKNKATTITLDYDDGDDTDNPIIVDVIDPVIERTEDNLSKLNVSNGIDRDLTNETGTVSVRIQATDKYLDRGILQDAENVAKIKVKVVKPDGETVYPDTITKQVSQISKQATSITYQITLGNFGENEGVTSVIIPEGVILDKYGNTNRETEVLVGNSTWTESGDANGEYTAFRESIVDFTRPVWEYSTSSITRDRAGETGTVTIKILGIDKYYLKDTLTEKNVSVYVENSANPDKPISTITKTLTKITDTAELNGADTGYILTLGNFGTYDGAVKITLSDNTIRDTSGNGNIITEIPVGNPNWVETDISDSADNPKYTAFRNNIVDFIKPTIKYQYSENANPVIDRENKQVKITFDAVDTNFLESNILSVDDIKQILVDDYDVTETITKELTKSDITDGSGNGIRYTLTLSNFELNSNLEDEIFRRHSGKIEFVIAEGMVKDTSGNTNIETKIIVDNDNGDDENNYIRADFIKPKLFYKDKFISWAKRYATVTISGTDRFYNFDTTLTADDILIYQLNRDGQYIQRTDLPVTVTPVKTKYGYDFVVRLDEFEEEFKQLKFTIPAGKISDLDGNLNDETDIIVDLDNKKPIWKYVDTDTSAFSSDGKISFDVKGQDTFLDLENSNLTSSDIKILKDGTDITASSSITVTNTGSDEAEVSKSYKIEVANLNDIGIYSLVIAKDTLIDEFSNKSATTTISFSQSAINSNTDNYKMITYHVTPDFKETHQAYVHELMSINRSGTNAESTTYQASSIGEIYGNGENTLFAEPFTYENGVQKAYSFKGWAVANEKGFSADDATIYNLYEEIPNTVTHLNAVWQEATVIFVSNKGNNSNDGKSPTSPVKDLQTAYSKLDADGKDSTNIIVIMDAIEWNSSDTLTGNATITSLYAGVDYRTQGAELKVSSNMNVNGDIIFDNIKLYSSSSTVNDGSDYLANGDYSNVLVTNYGDVILGRGISTPDDKYTFGAVVGGNYKEETTKNTIGLHIFIVEAGRYNDLIVGSSLSNQTTNRKYVTHQIIIGTMKEAVIQHQTAIQTRGARKTYAGNPEITGYLAMGEVEDRCYPYNRVGAQDTTLGYSRYYAITRLYSGTFTGDNSFNKADENASIYLRSINGFNDGIIKLDMYYGLVNGNIYGGSRMATTKDKNDAGQPDVNILNFYGGYAYGNVFGHGDNDTSTGNSVITATGEANVGGGIFGGSNATTVAQGKITGNTNIVVEGSASVQQIYGGSLGVIDGTNINTNTGLITGDTNITFSSLMGTNAIYGGGYNCGVRGSSNINYEVGKTNTIYGGAYQNQVQTATNINIYSGEVNDVSGGNELTTQNQLNTDNASQNTNIVIGEADKNTTPTITGTIYGGGKYDRVGTTEIRLVKTAKILGAVYGGSDSAGITNEANIYLNGITANAIYGGPKTDGFVTNSNIYLQVGTVTDVYGGGYGGTTTTSNVNVDGTSKVTNVFGGSNTNGTVETSNVELKTGTLNNVYGGGNSASVGTANVNLDGMKIDSIHGGSKTAGVSGTTNVVLNSGNVTDVYGGGYDVGATNANVTQKGASVTNIYGGNEGGSGDGGETTDATVNIVNSNATNVYGGNKDKGITRYTTINISGNSTIYDQLFGGGYKTDIGKSGAEGSTTINIAGGNILPEVYGGSNNGVVYGNTNINIGKDAVTNQTLTARAINLKANIFGAGTVVTTDYSETTVNGETHITLDNSAESPITFSGSIYGSGNGNNYTPKSAKDGSTIKIKDFGSLAKTHIMKSIERTGKLCIQNSYLELEGSRDKYNYYKNTSYTLNRITNGLTLLDNSTLYTQRGFNMVGGFESLVTTEENTTTKATATIADGVVTRNVDNRLYTYEGINLIFAKEEGDLANKAGQDIWGDVSGMAFFGMYRTSRTTENKEYDIYAPNYAGTATTNMFVNGTYVEGRHKANHNINVDGFYTNVKTDSGKAEPQVIDVTDNGTYYDWIVGAEIVNYNTSLIASTYSSDSMAELSLNFKKFVKDVSYSGTTISVDRVSTNAFSIKAQLMNKLNIPTYADSSEKANYQFGLTMQTTNSGWITKGITNLYTDNNGSFDGDTVYKTDNSGEPGNIIFKLYNSVNVSTNEDLGNMNIVLTGKSKTGEDATAGKVFKIVIAVNIQTRVEELNSDYAASYVPRFTDSIKTELNYTTDSSVDITYVLLENSLQENIYATGDYRVLSTTSPLPKGTKLTLRDFRQGDDLNKVYYYQIASDTDYDATDNSTGNTRYLYKLSKFIDMGGTSSSGKYEDNNDQYYHSGTGYAMEKYELSIDYMDTGLNTSKLAQETYLELRDSSGAAKYNNGDKVLKYNLYNQNATISEKVTTTDGKTAYSVYENLSIPFSFKGAMQEQKTENSEIIQDTKYYDKITGLAVEITDEHGERIKAPEVQNLKLVDNTEVTEYTPGADGVIRVPLADGLSKLQNSYTLSLSQNSVPAGQYIAKVYFFSSYDGKYYGGEEKETQEIYITFINKLLGLAGLESVDGSRIISKNTRLNLDGGDGLDLTVKVGSPTYDTNIRVELYKRNPTYTVSDDGTTTYSSISYTKVDLKDYLQSLDGSTYKTPEECEGQNLVTSDGCKEYMIMEKKEHPETTEQNVETISYENAIKENINTGEYKLVFKAYYNNTLIQTIRKTFIVTP